MRILILEVRNGSSLVLNGCEVESNKSAIKISPSNKPKSWEMFKMSIMNCNLKSTANEKNYGAITSFRFVDEPSPIIDKIGNFNGKIFTIKDKDGMSVGEFTSKKLVFKDGNLLLETDILEDSENNLGDNSEDNKQDGPTNSESNSNDNKQDKPDSPNNNEVHLGENNIQQGESATTENIDTKLPQTGEETNTFVTWLSIAISLGLFWLGSMLLIEHEKKKMIKR